jgi:hypothetical protein
MTVDEIRKDLGDDKYINSFKARRYIKFLISELDRMNARILWLRGISSRIPN